MFGRFRIRTDLALEARESFEEDDVKIRYRPDMIMQIVYQRRCRLRESQQELQLTWELLSVRKQLKQESKKLYSTEAVSYTMVKLKH